MKAKTFSLGHLELDFFSIPQMQKADSLQYSIKETKDRDGNNIFELTICNDEYGIFDTYTYYNKDEMVFDLHQLERFKPELTEA
jgi:hypothetical protein